MLRGMILKISYTKGKIKIYICQIPDLAIFNLNKKDYFYSVVTRDFDCVMPPRGRNYGKPEYKILLSLWSEKKMCLGEFYGTNELETIYNISSLIQQILDF